MMATTATAGMAFQTSGSFSVTANGDLTMVAGGDRTDHTVGNEIHNANEIVLTATEEISLYAPMIVLSGSEIRLEAGDSSIIVRDGGISIISSGNVEVNGAIVKLNC
jgi:uncharacterized protein (DUF2345 family)